MRSLALLLVVAACAGKSQPAPPPPPADAGVAAAAPVDAAPPPPDAAPPPPPDAAPPPPDAGPPPPPEITAENRCKRDSDCTLYKIGGCGPCGACPGPLDAINKKTARVWDKECAAERAKWKPRPGRKPPPPVACKPCPDHPPFAEKTWPTRAICDRGACVPAPVP